MLSSQFIPLNEDGRVFVSSRHIKRKQLAGIWLKQLADDVWINANSDDYQLVNNAIVFDEDLLSSVYSQVELRVGDNESDLAASPSDISILANIEDDIQTVADISNEVKNVSSISTDIVSLESIKAKLESLYADKAKLDSLFADKGTLDSLYADKAKLDSLFSDKATLDSLFADKATLDSLYMDKHTLDSLLADKVKLDSLYADKTKLDNLYANKDNITTVATSIGNVNAVGNDIANVLAVDANSANINSVVANEDNINDVALNIDSINDVVNDKENIYIVGSNISDINHIATQIIPSLTEILNADDNASIATTQANIATTQAGISTAKATESSNSATQSQISADEASASASEAANSASEAEASALDAEVAKIEWKGEWSAGAYNVSDGVSYLGSSFIANKDTSETPSLTAVDWDILAIKGDNNVILDVAYDKKTYIATEGQTVFVVSYDIGFVDVFVNGVRLIDTVDYSASNGTSVTMTEPLSAGTNVELIGMGLINPENGIIIDTERVVLGVDSGIDLASDLETTLIGFEAGKSTVANNADIETSIAIGYKAMRNASGVSRGNIAIGDYSADGLCSASGNIAIGSGATGGTSNGILYVLNIAIGNNAQGNAYNLIEAVSIGGDAHAFSTTGTGSVAIGANAGKYSSGGENVSIGMGSSEGSPSSVGTGGYNVAIGARSSSLTTTGQKNVLIGYNTQLENPTDNNKLVIGSDGDTLISGDIANGETKIHGRLNVSGLPTSDAGLVQGDIWIYSGTLKIKE